MIIGIDVTKDSSTRGRRLVVAFVSTLNGNDTEGRCTKHYSKCQIQEGDELYLTCLQSLMTGIPSNNKQ